MTKEKKKIENLALWIFPLLLMVPNFLLAYTEEVPLLYKIADISLTLGLYLIIVSITRNIGLVILLCIPLILFSGFQLILLYLYGGGIIAVDMFLNVVSTNVEEASELLFNLKVAMILVCLLYLPSIGWSIWALANGKRCDKDKLLLPRLAGWTFFGTGVVFIALCYYLYPKYEFDRNVFPINTLSNSYKAFQRSARIHQYPLTSQHFSYFGADSHPKQREIYVLVIGETSRADNWQLMGYKRPTNPRLSHCRNLVAYPHTYSESNTTHKSVPLLMTYLDANNYGDSIYYTKSIISAFEDAGYSTAFLSAQNRNRSFIEYFGSEADACSYIVDNGEKQIDTNLLPHLKCLLDTAPHQKLFVVLHTYGSHFSYNDRYPAEMAQFKPYDYIDADKDNRELLVNAYDNSIRHTDYFLDSLITMLAQEHVPSAMIYISDHGEDLYDDARGRFLHASPTPTFYQLHVPMIAWMSDEYRHTYPQKFVFATQNSHDEVDSSSSAFHTMLDLAGINSPYFKASQSLTSPLYSSHKKIYLDDYNECVSLRDCGFKTPDFLLLNSSNI